MVESCVFCKIIQKELPAQVITENEFGIVIADRAPKADVHWLVIPKVHVADLREISAQDHWVQNWLLLARAAVVEHGAGKPFKLVVNNGFEAGQRVFHLHAHILMGALHGSLD